MSPAQLRLLEKAEAERGIMPGGFGRAHHHRPARALEALGLLKEGTIPVPDRSFALRFVGVRNPRRAKPVFWCRGWCITKAGRRFLAQRRAHAET